MTQAHALQAQRWQTHPPLLAPIAPHARILFIIAWITLTLATHWPQIQLPSPVGTLFKPDKLIHTFLFVFFTLLAVYAQPAGRNASWPRQIFLGLLFAGAWAYIDESTQQWFSRVSSWADLLADLLGVALAAAALTLSPPMHLASPHDRARALRNAMLLVAALMLPVIAFGLITASPEATWTLTLPAAALITAALAHQRTRISHQTPAHQPDANQSTPQTDAHPVAAAHPAHKPASFVSHAALVSALTFLSRITGLIRDAVITAAFGLGPISDAFYLGFKVPNLFRRLFGEGALTAAFIPVYTAARQQDQDLARRIASACLGLQWIILGAITLAGELLLAWLLLGPAAQWSADAQLAVRLAMLMLPYMPLVCGVAVMAGVLQVHRRFGMPAAAPILLNFTLILAVAIVCDGVRGDEGLRWCAHIVALCVIAAGIMQLIWVGLAMIRVETFTLNWRGTAKPLRTIAVRMLPMLAGLAVFQVNAFLDSLIAMILSPKAGSEQLTILGYQLDYPIRENGAVAALELAQRLYQFPLGVFGIAIATAIFPALAAAAAAARQQPTSADPDRPDDQPTFEDILRRGMRLTVFIGLPAAVGLILVRLPLVRVLFEHARFELADSQRVAWLLIGYAAGVWAYSLTHVLTRAFHAVADVRTPLRVSVVMVAMNLLLNLILIWPLGAAGLAWSTALCAALQAAWLLAAVRRHAAQPLTPQVLASWRNTALITLIMALAVSAVTFALTIAFTLAAAQAPPAPILDLLAPSRLVDTLTGQFLAAQASRSQLLSLLGAQVLTGAAAVLISGRILRMSELRWLSRR